MATIEYLEERIRGLEIAKESSADEEYRNYVQRLIDGYKVQIERLKRNILM